MDLIQKIPVNSTPVIPAQAGIKSEIIMLRIGQDSRLRGNDTGVFSYG